MATKNVLQRLMSKKRLRVVGLMSGTSADGIDVAIVDMENRKVDLLVYATYPYPRTLRERLFSLFALEGVGVEEISRLNFALGKRFGQAVLRLCEEANINLSSLDLIGSHGQTVFHDPRGKIRSTLQIAEPAVIAQITGVTTVADFRCRDMAAGGEGAPLVPYADYILFRHPRRSRAIQNIGGIANVTYLPSRCTMGDILAFDSGPGNMVIDGLTSLITGSKQKYDKQGQIAAKGKVNPTLLRDMLKHPFLKRRPPKSTGREEFGLAYCQQLYKAAKAKRLQNPDIMATATAFTAVSIAQAYRKFLPQLPEEIILAGGGVHNQTLVRMIQQELNDVSLLMMDELGINSDAREAVSFAVLAYAAIQGYPNNVPSATGAEGPVILGKIIPA
jgi:anhydro-N-acetylmuramic acid kinase